MSRALTKITPHFLAFLTEIRMTINSSLKLRAVLFDFDGTLAPTLPLWISAYQVALKHYGQTLTEAEVLQHCFFRDWSEIATALNLGSATKFQLRVETCLQAAFLEAVLFPLARSVIERCRAQGMQTALVTSSPRHIVGGALTRLDLYALFDFTICGDEVQNYKPHPEPVTTTLLALNCDAANAIMIGDSHADILAGKAAGTRTALFLPDDHHRFHNTDRLYATEPDHTFRHHAELPRLLGLPDMTE
jgi:pyrophosphatase PpaX